ncbi:glycosyltransferase [Marinobacter hydrocarbonoclasticus]|nr:glycosyltransferase [Marinobacter nauticus]
MADLPSASNTAQTHRVSVLIASLGRSCLQTALHSILCNEHVAFEVVLILDDPTASPERILSAFSAEQRQRIRLLQNEKNLGITRSLNRGLAHCRGDIVARLDDDDKFAPLRLQRVVELFDANPDVDVIVTDTRVVDGTHAYRHRVPTTHEAIDSALQQRNVLVHSAFNVRRSALNRVGGYNDAFRFAQDFELYLRLLRSGARFLGVSEALTERVEGDGTITVSRRQHQALYSLSALCLHHASTWRGEQAQIRAVCAAFARFIAPRSLRKGVRWIRAVTRGGGR